MIYETSISFCACPLCICVSLLVIFRNLNWERMDMMCEIASNFEVNLYTRVSSNCSNYLFFSSNGFIPMWIDILCIFLKTYEHLHAQFAVKKLENKQNGCLYGEKSVLGVQLRASSSWTELEPSSSRATFSGSWLKRASPSRAVFLRA
jgi:hypothetical protein